mgnify:FL=1
MPNGALLLLAAGLGLLVGVWATVAFFSTERARRREVVLPPITDDQITASPILDSLPQDYIIVEKDGGVSRASTRAYSYGIVNDDDVVRLEFQRIIDQTQSDGLIHGQEIRMKRSTLTEDVESRLIVRSAPMSGGRILMLFEDSTAKLRLEEARRDFTANVSHELKTPVGSISLLSETIAKSADDPEAVRHFSAQLTKESRRLGILVQELIQLSRLQEGDAFRASELVSIDGVVAEAMDRMAVEAETRGVNLVTGGTKGLYVYGDRAMLTTAVRNLLDNAVRYSRPHGRVSIGVSTHDGLVSLAVVDQGQGITSEQQERVFERFYRGDKARSRDTGGSGLGLSIVKHVVADHGGRMNLWSAPGQGSTFTILLPEANRPAHGESDHDESAASPEQVSNE